jgi:radical SAM protein with 4Fe4S-binding SPASM domain
MNREDNLAKSTSLLARLAHEIKVKNAARLFDINRIAEDFYVPVLSVLYDCPELKNQNAIAYNYPAVDLGCDASRVSIQVTSDASSGKIIKTLKLFKEHELNDRFDTVYVLVLTEKQSAYPCSFQAALADGDLLDEATSLHDIWMNSDNVKSFRSYFASDRCGGCSHRTTCMNGCPIFDDLVVCGNR